MLEQAGRAAWLGCAVTLALTLGAGTARADIGAGAISFADTALFPASDPTDLPLGTSSYTLEAWIRPTSYGGHGIVGWGNYGAINQVNAFRMTDNGLANYWWDHDIVTGPVTLVDGNWHHVAATWDGTTRTIYVDGTVVAQQPDSAPLVTTSANFALGKTVSTEYFVGDIAEVRVWNVARNVLEINAHMATDLAGNESGLVALYEFEEGSGATTADGAGTPFPVTLGAHNTWVATGLGVQAAAIPTLSEWGMLLMMAALLGTLVLGQRRTQAG